MVGLLPHRRRKDRVYHGDPAAEEKRDGTLPRRAKILPWQACDPDNGDASERRNSRTTERKTMSDPNIIEQPEARPVVACSDLLGVNRVGTKILGVAWGEQDRQDAALLASADEVRNFLVEEWIGDKDDPLVADVMRELAAHDWNEDSEITWRFEVGGVTLRDVFDMTPNDKSSHAGAVTHK